MTPACTAIVAYDPDLPIHMKDGMMLVDSTLKTFKTCQICHKTANKFFQVCVNGCISCENCDDFFNSTRRGKQCKQCKSEVFDKPIFNKAFTEISGKVSDIYVELNHGLNQIKNHGYVTEGMANGEVAPNWVPISRDKAMKEAMDFLKNDPTLLSITIPLKKKNGIPSKEDFETEEEWNDAVEKYQEKKIEKSENAKERKRKLDTYDALVEELEECKSKIARMENMYNVSPIPSCY